MIDSLHDHTVQYIKLLGRKIVIPLVCITTLMLVGENALCVIDYINHLAPSGPIYGIYPMFDHDDFQTVMLCQAAAALIGLRPRLD